MIKLIVFDLDNVIIDGEAIDEIAKLADVEDKVAEITKKAMQGELDFETSIKNRVQLLEGISLEDVQKIASELPFVEGVEDTIKSLKENDLDVAIISGSFDIIADEIKNKLDIDYAFANSFIVEDGKLSGNVEGPLVSGSKLDVLNQLIAEKDISLDEVVAVGDGANDISMIEASGCGIAFNAKDSVKEIADVIVDERDLTKILDYINQSSDEEVDEDAEETIEEVVEEDNSDKATENLVEEDVEEVVEEDEATENLVEEDVEEVVEEDEAAEDVVEDDNSDAKEEKIEETKSDFVLADTIEGVRQQKNEKEALIAQITEEREEFNRIAKEQRKIRDELNASLKENLNKAIEFRNTRNEINKEVTEAKKVRNEANNKIKNLEWSSGKRDKIKIENEIRKIDKIIETRVLDIKKENQLVKNANDLRKQLHEIKEDESVKGEAQELKNESEEAHSKVIELSEKAQEAHEEMLKYFRATDDIRTAADNAHKQFIEARKNASAKHEEFKTVLSDIRIINKKLGSNRPRRRRANKKSINANKNSEEKEKAEAIFEKFKNGGKLSTDELLLLQKYNIG